VLPAWLFGEEGGWGGGVAAVYCCLAGKAVGGGVAAVYCCLAGKAVGVVLLAGPLAGLEVVVVVVLAGAGGGGAAAAALLLLLRCCCRWLGLVLVLLLDVAGMAVGVVAWRHGGDPKRARVCK